MRLATAYINLSESGFVHRLQWNKEFDCCKDQIEGESIAEELATESTSMENCYSNWRKKVSDARTEYRELNFFTTQQLMLLRKEIAAVCHSNDLLVADEDDLLLWCLEEADEADIEALYEEARQNPIIVREIFSDRELGEMQAEEDKRY